MSRAGDPDRLRVKVKRLRKDRIATLPTYASEGSSGLDLRADLSGPMVLQPGEIRLIPTGIALSLPPGYEAQVRARSGLALRHGIGLVNAPGTVDSDYRGEIKVVLVNWGKVPFLVQPGDRIAQMVITRVCRAELVEVEELDPTGRGPGGFGHTGIG